MNIVFCSPMSGHGATTSNMACISVMSSIMNGKRAVSFQSGYSHNNLNQTLLKRKAIEINQVKEEFSYYVAKGMDGILRGVSQTGFTNCTIEDYCMEVVKGKNYYIPNTLKNSKELYYEKMNSEFRKILEMCNREFDLTFIDNQGEAELNKRIMDIADLLVVNINQNPGTMEMAMEFKEEYPDKNIIFLVGRYDENSRYDMNYLVKNYRLSKEEVAVIPYNTSFLDATINGGIKGFLERNITCTRRNENYYFISQVKKTMEKIYRRAGVVIES